MTSRMSNPAWPTQARRVRVVRKWSTSIALAGMLCMHFTAFGDQPPPWGNWPLWGDQRDGTYRNPILPADYSDIDCIRVGGNYYMISSTMQYSPGMVVLRSRDMVNWQTIGHVVGDLTTISPELGWDRMNRAGRGIWAGAIRHHDGRFWVYFGTPDEGYFMSTAHDPAGPWAPLHQLMDQAGWDDCCPFWDDDGQAYFVGTEFKAGYKTWLFRLSADGTTLDLDSRILLNEGFGREANKLYKIKGTYYHLYSEHRPGVGRYLMMKRARRITGPYGEPRQLSEVQADIHEPNQGGLVQAENGQWYFLTHHGTGAWEGRPASLLPVTWIDKWPIIGKPNSRGIGEMVWHHAKPVVAKAPMVFPQTPDSFDSGTLHPQWEWYYQPRADKWSLGERPGFLRLKAFKPLRAGDLRSVGNMLTQRAWRTPRSLVTVKVDPRGMVDGQVAGLCNYAGGGGSALVIRKEAGNLHLQAVGKQIDATQLLSMPSDLWLRCAWGLEGTCGYSYSLDGSAFKPLGGSYQLTWGDYRGSRIGLFTCNDAAERGVLDIAGFDCKF